MSLYYFNNSRRFLDLTIQTGSDLKIPNPDLNSIVWKYRSRSDPNTRIRNPAERVGLFQSSLSIMSLGAFPIWIHIRFDLHIVAYMNHGTCIRRYLLKLYARMKYEIYSLEYLLTSKAVVQTDFFHILYTWSQRLMRYHLTLNFMIWIGSCKGKNKLTVNSQQFRI